MAQASYLSLYNTKQTIGSDYRFQIYSYNSSYLHKVVLKCGSYSKTWDRVKGGVETNYTVPLNFANAMPNATSMTGTLTVTTYQSNYATRVGSNDVENVTFSINYNTMTPDIDVTITEAVDGIAEQFGAYVQSKSKITMNIAGTGIYGSTIKNYNSTINGATYTKNEYTTGVLKLDTDVDYTYRQWTARITDSRGQVDNQVGSYKILSYHNPKINSFAVIRCNADGVPNDKGTYVKVTSNASIKPCNDGTDDKNTKAFKLSYKLTTDDTWADIDITGDSYDLSDERILSDFDINNTYNFKLEATDFFSTSSKITNLETSDNIMDFHYSGNGMAIGKASELEDTLDIGYTSTYLSKHTHIGGYKTTDDEKNIYFNNTGNGDYHHNLKIYGGAGSSIVSLGIWDYIGEHRVVYYESSTKTLKKDPNIKLSGFKDIATVIGNADLTLTTTDITEVPMKASVTLGSKLIVSNGQVVIGAGVSYVKIEGSVYANNSFVENDLVHCNILKNSQAVYSAIKRIKSTYETVAGAGKIISVAEGDVIKLCARNQTEARGIISGTGNATYMTVEVVG